MIAFIVRILAVVLGVILAYWLERIFNLRIPGGLNGQVGYVVICIALAELVLAAVFSIDYDAAWRRLRKPQPPG